MDDIGGIFDPVWLESQGSHVIHWLGHNLLDRAVGIEIAATLLGIWERFQAAAIEIPYPQSDVHIRSLPPSPPVSPYSSITRENPSATGR